MALEVYYPTDIRNVLLAVEQAVSATAEATDSRNDPFTAGFLTGYGAALASVALAFGLTAHSDALIERQTMLPFPAALRSR